MFCERNIKSVCSPASSGSPSLQFFTHFSLCAKCIAVKVKPCYRCKK